jgi:energy-coupling factor transporter ATP-binding protein EcfA2
VESALDAPDFSKFCDTLKNTKTKKNIVVTTNDFRDAPEKLYPYVDRVLILDTTQVN